MDTTSTPIEFDKYFHIYNRGINSCVIFRDNEDCKHFLKLYLKYISPVAETYAYCLMRNHFHFFVKIKAENEIGNFILKEDDARVFAAERKYNPTRQFSHLFNAYAKGNNTKYSRTGKLLETPFRRIAVTDLQYIKSLIRYINLNPVSAGITQDFTNYLWSSGYYTHQRKSEIADIEASINFFGELSDYLNFHNNSANSSNFIEPEWE